LITLLLQVAEAAVDASAAVVAVADTVAEHHFLSAPSVLTQSQ
jgi:hypothetical protein